MRGVGGVRVRTRGIAAVTVMLAATLPALGAPSGGGAATAGSVHPLVADGLAALDALAEACVERDALDGDTTDGAALPFRFCDDGPSRPGAGGIPVPVAYHPDPQGNDYRGLPAPATPEEVVAAQLRDDVRPEPPGDRVTLDVDLSLPPATMAPPQDGFPIIVFLHGGGGDKAEYEATSIDGSSASGSLVASELWHRSNSWFASRGYVVVTFSQRLSVLHASPATLQVSRRYDANDAQYLAGLLADSDALRREAGAAPLYEVDPQRIATSGYSSGSHLTWMTVTDSRWTSPATAIPMRLAAAFPYAGFTDLPEIIAPTGRFFDRDPAKPSRSFVAPVDPAEALSRRPVGALKQSFLITVLCTGDPELVFAADFQRGCKRLSAGQPYDPADPVLERWFARTLTDMSPYYQTEFWDDVAGGLRVPVLAVQGLADAITPPIEAIRFYNKLRSIDPSYPIGMVFGDVGHYALDRMKEWADLCGADRHVCAEPDFTRPDGSIDTDHVPSRVREGIATAVNRFLEHNLRGAAGTYAFDVAMTTQVCPATLEGRASGEAGVTYRAPSVRALASVHRVRLGGAGRTLSAASDPQGAENDPTVHGEGHGGLFADLCYTTSGDAPRPGVVSFDSKPFRAGAVMLGLPTVRLRYEAAGFDYQIGARLYDVGPAGERTLVTRGVCVVSALVAPGAGCDAFDLFGNGWTFAPGHRMSLEISQADAGFLRPNSIPSSLEITGAALDVPLRRP